MSQVTTIDLGSNSFRVLVYNYKHHIVLKEYSEIVGTADGLVNTGIISNEATSRIIKAIKTSTNELNYNPKSSVCVTTAAMRIAKNSDEVLEKIYNETGVKLNVIDGHEEARLTLVAIKHALKREKIQSKKFILLDIGGGSTELTINDDEVYCTKSFDFGIVTLGQKHTTTQQLIDELETKKYEIKKYLEEVGLNLDEYVFISTAGTPTTVAAIKHGQNFLNYDKNVVNGTVVNLEDINYCLNIMKEFDQKKLNEIFGENRKELIEVGILIFKSIFEVLDKKESIVLDDGLREGVAINYAEQKKLLR